MLTDADARLNHLYLHLLYLCCIHVGKRFSISIHSLNKRAFMNLVITNA